MFLWLSMNFLSFLIKGSKKKTFMHEIFMQLQVMGSLLVVKIFECLNIGKTLINSITVIHLIEEASLIEDFLCATFEV